MSCMSFMPWPDELGGRVPGNEGTEGIVGCSAMVVIAGGIEVLKEEEKDGEVQVRFGATLDCRIGEGEDVGGRVLHRWAERLHLAYARYLLDEAVKKIRSRAADTAGSSRML